MAQGIIPFSLIEAVPKHSRLASQQELDRHFLADCLMKSVLGRSLPSVANSVEQLQKNKQYECDICNKSYPSFQALGGHKSIHNSNNKRTRVENTHVIVEKSDKRPRCLELFPTTTSSSDTETGSSFLKDNREEGEIASSFECDTCHKTFSTYQALGGHKSSHFYNKSNRTTDQQPTNIINSHKWPTYLQLFPESPSTRYETKRASASSCIEKPGKIDLELRLGIRI